MSEHEIIVDYKFTDQYWNWYKCVKCGARDSIIRGRPKNLLSFYNKLCIPLTKDTKTMYTDVVSDGDKDPRNKNDQLSKELILKYLIDANNEIYKQKPMNSQELESKNSFVSSFSNVIWWLQNKK